MIDIYDIKYGWAVLQIGYCDFSVSYLTDLIGEIDVLLDLKEDEYNYECRKAYFEGESAGDLALISHLTYERIGEALEADYVINIVWQRVFCGEPMSSSITVLKFPYKQFKQEWQKVKDKIRDDYVRNFLCEEANEDE